VPKICSFKTRKPLVAPRRQTTAMAKSSNIKQADMKRTFLYDITELLAYKPTRQRNEVLFFATAHFLLFNSSAIAQNTLSLFLLAYKINRQKL
jgi:hypothetical protein